MTIALHHTTPLKYLLVNPITCTLIDSMYHAALSEDLTTLHIARTNTDTNDLRLEWYIKSVLPEASTMRVIYVADNKLHVIATPISDPHTLFIHVTDVETTFNGYTCISLSVRQE